MEKKVKIFAVCGSASLDSANLGILKTIAELGRPYFKFEILNDLTAIPHFKTEITDVNVPEEVTALRNEIANADGTYVVQ